ncbi:MAG: alkaline phosphatase D family protein [Aquificaceae bacterium]
MLTRREFLEGSIAGALLLSFNSLTFATDTEEVFPQGIASGDPTQRGFILWTRINPKVHAKMNKDLILQIAEDMDFKRVLMSGRVDGQRIRREEDYTLRIDLKDGFETGKTYYYRFIYADVPSMVGRVKTLPEKAQEISLAFVVCQGYADGYYTAYRHIAQEEVQLVLHLGDFIYERIYGRPRVPGRDLNLPSGQNIVQDLEDYRYLYRTYLLDPDLKLARATHPFVNTWDDHEFINDYYYDYSYEVWRGSYPSQARERLLQLRLASIRAWLEYIPARVSTNFSNRDPLMWIRIYRDFNLGGLAHLIITDERSYRDKQPCGKRYGAPGCPEQQKTTMLGDQQLRWFKSKLKEGSYPWKVWANSVQLAKSLTDGREGLALWTLGTATRGKDKRYWTF